MLIVQKKSLTPRNGHTLVTGIIARISGSAGQKDVSLEDQEDHGRAESAAYYNGPTEFRLIATKGKGERLDRPELLEIEEMLRTRELDLLICEDIGRLIRGTEAVRLCGIAVDNGTRVIVPHDCIDTAEETWEEDVIGACRDHVSHNAHTSRRLKKKLMRRFERSGGAMARPIFGYVVPHEAKTYDDWLIDPAAAAVIVQWFRRLRGPELFGDRRLVERFRGVGRSLLPHAGVDRCDGPAVDREPGVQGSAGTRSEAHHQTPSVGASHLGAESPGPDRSVLPAPDDRPARGIR